MNIKIGSIIKKLRAEMGTTQEQLAAAIGVTPQAISRWESENGYPDIELLPALADFFNVSTDELLGYKLSEREEELARIKKEIERLSEVGETEESLAFARNSFSRYPNDHEIKENLACWLYIAWDETKDKKFLSESELLYTSLVEECRDENIKYNAMHSLIGIYQETNRVEKAVEMANRFSPLKYCRESIKSCGIGDGNTEYYIQDEIDKLTDSLGIAIRNLVLDDDLPNDPSTWDKKIEMMKMSNQLYLMIYGENLMFHHCRLSFNHWIISTYEMSQGKHEDAILSLQKMCRHAIEYDKSYKNDHGKLFTSIFVDKIEYPVPSKDFHELHEHSDAYYMLGKLSHERYDPIREDERFIAIIDALKEYER